MEMSFQPFVQDVVSETQKLNSVQKIGFGGKLKQLEKPIKTIEKRTFRTKEFRINPR